MEVKNERVQLQGTVYIDSLFLLNLVMDLYLLLLTAKLLGKTVTFSGILAGSTVGAAGYCIILCLPGVPYALKVLLGMIPVGGLMVKIACKVRGIKELLRAMGYLYCFSFLSGGFILFLKGQGGIFAKYGDSFAVLAGLGFAVLAAGEKLIRACRKRKQEHFCRVSLPGDAGTVEINALIDTGNGLSDPVSRRPVAILEEERWKELRMWMKPEKYKVIPYHSIGRERGLLEGYEIDTIKVKGNEREKQYDKVIVAVFKGKISAKGSYQMILPPELSI